MLKYVRHVSLFLFTLVVRISCYEFLVQSSFLSRFHRNSIRQLQLSNLKVASSKTSIFPVEFHPRLAVSKWIVPRSFLMGGVRTPLKTRHCKLGKPRIKRAPTDVADAANVQLRLLNYFSTQKNDKRI